MTTNEKIPKIIVDSKGDEGITKELTTKLKIFNEKIIGPYQREPFNIYAKTEEDKIIAGIYGNTLRDLCCVNIFWVDENFRHKGIGSKLQCELEKYAQSKGCGSIQLDTAQFQAKDFYVKVGFSIVATIPKGFMGYDAHIMRKVI